MSKEETIKLLTILGKNYTDFQKRMSNKQEANDLTNLWYECFKDMPYEIVSNAIKKTLLTCKYVPTIAEVRENCLSLVNKQTDILDLWIDAYKMLSNGIYMTKDQFESYPIECQKFFGNTKLLKEMSSDSDINLDVVRSNFYKQVDIIQRRQKQDDLLPQNLRLGAMINKLSEKMSIGGN